MWFHHNLSCAALLVCFTSIGLVQSVVSAETRSNTGEEKPCDRFHVAVVGAGLTGSATVHFLSELVEADEDLKGKVNIHVFEEKQEVGGRLQTVTIDGEKYEVGDAVMCNKNRLLRGLVKEMGLRRETSMLEGDAVGAFDGQGIVVTTSQESWASSFTTYIKLFLRYGLDPFRLSKIIDIVQSKIEYLYTLLVDSPRPYDSVVKLLQDAKLYDYTQITLHDYLRTSAGLSEALINELVTGIIRLQFGQEAQINALAGTSSLGGGSSRMWSIQGGNSQLCEKLLYNPKNSDSVVVHLKHRVAKLFFDTDGSPALSIQHGNETQPIMYGFDSIVFATALEEDAIAMPAQATEFLPQDIHYTFVTFVKGSLNASYFGADPTRELPSLIMSIHGANTSFDGIAKLRGSPSNIHGGTFKIFSKAPLSHDDLSTLFVAYDNTSIIERMWDAYPMFSPPEEFSSFKLLDGVFYPSAMQNAMPGLEALVLSAKNAALEVHTQLKTTCLKETKRLKALNAFETKQEADHLKWQDFLRQLEATEVPEALPPRAVKPERKHHVRRESKATKLVQRPPLPGEESDADVDKAKSNQSTQQKASAPSAATSDPSTSAKATETGENGQDNGRSNGDDADGPASAQEEEADSVASDASGTGDEGSCSENGCGSDKEQHAKSKYSSDSN
eukprot:m.117262 g.117262  ORF g.117262 m.117262 type:complete len:672 (+) comp13625_c0_seq6:102-2117(+)